MNATAGGKEQVPHVDFMFNEETKLSDDSKAVAAHPYFTMVTIGEYTVFWILESSHRYAGVKANVRHGLGKSQELRLIFIPPWSIII